jgi:ribonucleoside-diphosphate reductase alpha chain
LKYEADKTIPKKTVPAQDLFFDLLKERAETGRIYIMNLDHCNSHSSFKDKVSMSNLCQEITLPTTPIQDIHDDQGEIALCILSAINVGQLGELGELENLCDLSVRALEQIIDYQDYPVKAAEVSTKRREVSELDISDWRTTWPRTESSTTRRVLGNLWTDSQKRSSTTY